MDIRTYGLYSVIICILGVGATIFSVVFLLTVLQSSEQLPGCKGWEGDKDGVDTFKLFVLTISAGGIAAGICAIVAGAMGYTGSITERVNHILTSVGFVGVVIPMASLLTILGFSIGASIDGECADRECDTATGRCNKIGCKDLGTGLQDCQGWCQNEYEYLCDDSPTYFTACAIIFAVVFFCSIPSCICGCGAACACPDQFFKDPEQEEEGAMMFGRSSTMNSRASF